MIAKGLSSKIEWSRKKKRKVTAMKSLVEPISPWLQKDFMKTTQRTHTLQREIKFKIIPDCDTLAIKLKTVFHNIL